jgi:hypothetical protein
MTNTSNMLLSTSISGFEPALSTTI